MSINNANTIPPPTPQSATQNQDVQSKKKGGPYNKEMTEKRRQNVFTLHFEISHNAVEIAKMFGVNRNTINSDIKHLYSQIAQQSTTYDIKSLLARQMIRLDADRAKLCRAHDLVPDHNQKISIMRSIINVDSKVSQMLLKILLDKQSFGRKMFNDKQPS